MQKNNNELVRLAVVGIVALMVNGCGGSPTVNRAENNDGGKSVSPSLPRVGSGRLPGPAVLYEPAPIIPELSLQAPFSAEPLMVSGTDAYCRGEYIYQDYLFDDHGANTSPSTGPTDSGAYGSFPPTGDVSYPTDAIYAGNAADIVEFRMHIAAQETTFRITLNTLVAESVPVIGIGIARDQDDVMSVAWPNGAGVESEGLDRFITVWANGAEMASRSAESSELSERVLLPASAVDLDLESNQITARIPTSWLNPEGTWRLVAGAGLWDGDRGFMPVAPGDIPNASQPVSGGSGVAPGVFNLAFRFDEPQGLLGGDSVIAFGNWFDDAQANALAEGHSGTAVAEINIAQLMASKQCEWVHAPGRDQARIFASRMQVPEGIHDTQPSFGGRLQPYMIHLPEASARLPGFTLALHGNGATYTQWHATSPNYLVQVGDNRNHIVLSPLGRSTSRTGVPFDWFEAWGDAARHFQFDSERTAISGYSAGGYSTFYTAASFPDLFGAAFPIVAAARLLDGGGFGDFTNYIPHMRGLRWVPLVAWNQAVDELAPYVGIRLTADELNSHGLRHEIFTFPVGEHFTPGLLDQWTGGAEYLGDAEVVRDPYRVDFTIAPENWQRFAPPLGASEEYPEAYLVADHVYWVSELQARDDIADETGTVRGSITAISKAFGLSEADTSIVLRAYPGPPTPATVDGLEWSELATIPAEDRLTIEAENIASVTIDVERARLSCAAQVDIQSDGPMRVVLAGCNREVVSD